MHYHIKQQESKKANQTSESRKLTTIMTKIFMSMSNSNPLRDPATTDITVMLDSQTKELIKYQSAVNDSRKTIKSFHTNEEHIAFKKSFGAPKEDKKEEEFGGIQVNNVYPKGVSLEVRQDLVDCDIAICTEDVLNLFSDNFDKTNLKDSLVNWLYESEVSEHRIRVFEVSQKDSYYARISNPRLYGVTQRSVI